MNPEEWLLHEKNEGKTGDPGNSTKRYWEHGTDSHFTSLIDPRQLNSDYYETVFRFKKQKRAGAGTAYMLGGYQKFRRTLSNARCCQDIVIEDFPVYAIEREKCTQLCLDVLTNATKQDGEWKGDTKTASAIRKQGWRQGLQGLFGRILWYELLEQVQIQGDVGGLTRDSIFPTNFLGDPAVKNEFLEAGRTEEQVAKVMRAVGSFMEEVSQRLQLMRNQTNLKSDGLLNKIDVKPKDALINPNGSATVMYSLTCCAVTLNISHEHLTKLLRLYRLHTDKDATLADDTFVSCLQLLFLFLSLSKSFDLWVFISCVVSFVLYNAMKHSLAHQKVIKWPFQTQVFNFCVIEWA
jgi:hypothetical protein